MFGEIVPSESKCRCVMLTGAGKAFSAGIELGGANTLGDIHSGNLRRSTKVDIYFKIWRCMARRLESNKFVPKPVIACIQRGCFGAALRDGVLCRY